MCDDLLSKDLISSYVLLPMWILIVLRSSYVLLTPARLVQESTGKPCYYIDPKSAVDSVRRRLKAMRKNVDSYKKPTETETMKCGHCETALSYEDLQYPTGTGGFVCPGCNMELELIPLPTSSEAGRGNTVRDDLNYFFSLLMEADKACKAETENEKSRF